MQRIIVLTLLIFNTSILYSQRELSTDEIINYFYKLDQSSLVDNDTNKLSGFTFNTELNKYVDNVIDCLNDQDIDTIIIYTISPRGSYLMNKNNICVDLRSPISIYILWKFENNLITKEINNGCDKGNKIIDSTSVFDFFFNNKDDINREIIMPIIYGAVIENDSILSYSGGGLYEGQNKYCIIYKNGDSWEMIGFGDDVFTEKANRFYNYNINLKTYKWFMILNNQINKIYD